MQRFLRWLTLVNAFRIGLATGLFFSLVHLWQVAARQEIPIITKMEDAMVDVRFHQRGRVDHPDRVVVGDTGDWAGDAVVELYEPLNAPVVRTDRSPASS